MPARPTMFVIAGPNGAGKSSAAPYFLPSRMPLERYVNPDVIAASIDPADPWTARQAAGKRALERISGFVERALDFGLETTLSGRWTTHLIERLLAAEWRVDLSFLWLPDAERAVDRVSSRAERERGHSIPPEDVRRRHARGLANFEVLRSVVSIWRVVDRREVASMSIIAEGMRDEVAVADETQWNLVPSSIDAARRVLGVGRYGGGEEDARGRIVGEPERLRPRQPASTGGAMHSDARDDRAHDVHDVPGEAPAACFAAADRATILRHRAQNWPLLFARNGRTVEVDPWTVPLPRIPATDENGKLVKRA